MVKREKIKPSPFPILSIINQYIVTSFDDFLAIAQFHNNVLTIVCNHETFCASSVGYQQCATATDNVGQFFVFKHSSIKFVGSPNDKSPCTPQPRQVVQRQDRCISVLAKWRNNLHLPFLHKAINHIDVFITQSRRVAIDDVAQCPCGDFLNRLKSFHHLKMVKRKAFVSSL